MPACRQCGKDNPEGTAFCGYCATPLARPVADPVAQPPISAGNPVSPPPPRVLSPPPKPPPRPLRPDNRSSVRTPPSGGKGGFELLPWSELSPGQRAGRAGAALVLLFLIFFFLRGMLYSLIGSRASSQPAPSAEGSNAPISDGDRKDGIESLCKVFQIYGLPKNDHDASEAARNAGELFKLAGNQSPERSQYILTTIVGEFRTGQLGQADCSAAGATLPPTQASPDNPDSQ